MKQLLPLLLLLPIGSRAQVAMSVLEPPSIAGGYEHTWAEASNGWATPDMNVVANLVVDTVVLAYDGTAGDSLVCDPPISIVEGKIALLYRGTCDYSEKALNCQDAGAVAVLIVNNSAGAPVGMGGSVLGPQVTIPVFQMRQDDGAALRGELDAGSTVVALLGNKAGYFDNDVAVIKRGVLNPVSTHEPHWLAADASEYSLQVAAWVNNFGQAAQDSVRINAKVIQGATTLYSETSAAQAINGGDSAFFTLPDFNQPTYGGDYTLTYSALTGADQFELDNTFAIDFSVDDLFGYGPWNDAQQRPAVTIGTKPNPGNGEYQSCLHFRDANASRVGVAGMYLYAAVNSPATLDGELLTLRILEWQDVFDGISDADFNFATLVEVSTTEHVITVDTNQYYAYVPIEPSEQIVLQDDLRYLFCVSTSNENVFLGFNENLDYSTNESVYDQPTTPIMNGPDWFLGFTSGNTATLTVRMVDAAEVGIAEPLPAHFGAAPNPGTGLYQLTLENTALPAVLTINDPSGRVVRTERIVTATHLLDLRGMAKGVYHLSAHSAEKMMSARVVLE